MNALRPSIARTATRFQRRNMGTAGPRGFSEHWLKENWFSDPACYPIFVVWGCAVTFVFGMASNALFTYKQGVDISPNTRGVIMKPYTTEHRRGIVEKFVGRGAIHAEGMGVDEEAWKKQKEAYYKE